MIRRVIVTNHLGDSITLDLANPELSGFVVEKITGLGPGVANINSTEVATTDGGVYNSARLPSRNIVMTLKFLCKNSIEDVRQQSYKYFPIKKKIKLRVETDNRILAIDGYVESNEPDIFSPNEGSQISIICPNPYFYSDEGSGKNVIVFSGTESLFEFPFSNESLTENLLEMGAIETRREGVIMYEGDSEIGITITIRAYGEASNITIYNLNTRGSMHIDTSKLESLTGSGIISGDVIIISTTKGDKSVQLLRNGKTTNILNCIDKTAEWFQLTKGANLFAYIAETGGDNLHFKIENKTLYEGV